MAFTDTSPCEGVAGIQECAERSLAGRFFLHRCTHWSWPECRAAFGWTLDQWVYYGGYPGAAALIEEEAAWRRYVNDSLIPKAKVWLVGSTGIKLEEFFAEREWLANSSRQDPGIHAKTQGDLTPIPSPTLRALALTLTLVLALVLARSGKARVPLPTGPEKGS